MSTPNLAIPHILQSQAQKEVTANEAFDRLDEAVNDLTTINVSGGNTTIPAEECPPGPHRHAGRRARPDRARQQAVVHRPERLRPGRSGDHGRAGAQVVLTSGERRLLYGRRHQRSGHRPDFASTGGSAGAGGGFPVFKGALIKRTSNVTIASSVLITLAWQSTVYDTDGFVNLGVQPTRLTVPAGKGITRAQVLCGVQ